MADGLNSTRIARRHLLGGVAVMAAPTLPAVAAGDNRLLMAYDRYTALSRAMNYLESPVGISAVEEERIADERFEESQKWLSMLLSASPQGPVGAAVLALTAIRRSDAGICQRRWHHEWDGYSRPIDAVMEETNILLWNIADWGLRHRSV
ncbi:hypothetical protein [Niveispirillum sp.]|uniref:hypothetical protein n=1 Tax=Niveispirillum sp. TaxID=1917217 RepID=UPI001B594AA5|nr:hypothetical protein [Niveispirillum sp.]MBP7339089.1 hypothetical protein [Niveispirillum sp.]